jgi:hypothetical protein
LGGLQALVKGDSLPAQDLPARPNLDQYKKQAKELLEAIRVGDPDALDRLHRRTHHSTLLHFLIERGIDIGEGHRGETALHVAAYGGHADVVSLLLTRGAPLTAEDEIWGGMPLGWVFYAWSNTPDDVERDRYYRVIELLIDAGATVQPEWLDDEGIVEDARMLAALGRGRSE